MHRVQKVKCVCVSGGDFVFNYSRESFNKRLQFSFIHSLWINDLVTFSMGYINTPVQYVVNCECLFECYEPVIKSFTQKICSKPLNSNGFRICSLTVLGKIIGVLPRPNQCIFNKVCSQLQSLASVSASPFDEPNNYMKQWWCVHIQYMCVEALWVTECWKKNKWFLGKILSSWKIFLCPHVLMSVIECEHHILVCGWYVIEELRVNACVLVLCTCLEVWKCRHLRCALKMKLVYLQSNNDFWVNLDFFSLQIHFTTPVNGDWTNYIFLIY